LTLRLTHKSSSLIISFCLIAVLSWLQLTSYPPAKKWINRLQHEIYDLTLQSSLGKLSAIQNNSIAIIAIDDKSLAAEGQWPWPRQKIANLVTRLQAMHASVIAFDIAFTEPEGNAVDDILDDLQNTAHRNNTSLINSLRSIRSAFNDDENFAAVLAKSDNTLGYIFQPNSLNPVGELPKPLLALSKQDDSDLDIVKMTSYIANLPILQNAARFGGFINATPDEDSVMRYAPLVYQYQDKIYPSLALEAVRLYLISENVSLITTQYGNTRDLEGIKIDNFTIPTDTTGRILIPFRAGPYGYPYYSATDILSGVIPTSAIEGKLIFIGATASGLGDTHPAAVASTYNGVEVHATIASSILDHYFPSYPEWNNGFEFLLMLITGLIAACVFPFLNAAWLALIIVIIPLIWWSFVTWLWVHKGIFLPLTIPMLTLMALALINMVGSYFAESHRRKEIKLLFGQYVPETHVEALIKHHGETSLEGESRVLTVLFSDIRGFTTLSETMTAAELKKQLNAYLTPMTEIIFKTGGTIDKYVGDMIMAFWNAPLVDKNHAEHGITAALAMQNELTHLNEFFNELKLPTINIGIGLNTDLMNVGDMGSKFRRAYTALGDGVNFASRLEGLCRVYEAKVIAGEGTYAETKHQFAYQQLDRVVVKGKLTPIAIYEPIVKIDEATDELCHELELHHQGLEAYFQQRWDAAESIFMKLVTTHPDKYLYKLYLQRINDFKQHPPAKDWNGAYISQSK
jgi:adenylate cyclase